MDGISIVKTGIRCETFIPYPLLLFDQPTLFVESDGGSTDGYLYMWVNGFHRCSVFFGFRYVGPNGRVFVEVMR